MSHEPRPPPIARPLALVVTGGREEAVALGRLPSYPLVLAVLASVARGLLAGWMPEDQARRWRPVLERLAAGSTDARPARFFPGDPVPPGPCQDDLARRWGLARGPNVSRLRQALEPPSLC